MLTVSRQLGAGGDEIARLVAAELGWRLLDSALVEKLLVEKGFPKALIQCYDERKPDIWTRISAGKERYLNYLKLITYEFARQGDLIMLGRGGQLLFASVPGALKVQVVAPLEHRVRRFSRETGLDLQQSLRKVQHVDNERAGFHRFLFHADWLSSCYYDLVINTALLPPQAAVGLILQTLASDVIRSLQEQVRSKLEELYLTQKAIFSILYEHKLPVHYLQIEVRNGAVTLRGVAQDHPSIERCQEIAAEVFDNKKIDNEISFEPKYVQIISGLHRKG